jgi:hypothetical protein
VSFEDDKHALNGIGNVCKERGIPYTLFQYTGAEKLLGTFDIRRALKQLKALIQERRWITDRDIDKIRL